MANLMGGDLTPGAIQQKKAALKREQTSLIGKTKRRNNVIDDARTDIAIYKDRLREIEKELAVMK
jgi:hypothetical protein